MTKMESLEPGSSERFVMESLFKLAARDLMPTIGQEAGQTEAELKESLIDLWDHDLLRWVSKDVESDSEPCFFLEMLHLGKVWKAVNLPQIH